MKVNLLLSAATLLLLSACSIFGDGDEKAPLEGERLSVMELQKNLEPDTALQSDSGAFTMPKIWKNAFWPQSGGYPNHSMQNLALGDNPQHIWDADIGQGTTARFPLTAQPIVVGEQIFTLDTDFNLTSFNTKTGKKIWDRNVESKAEDDPVISGGISYGENKLFVTNGYNEVLAVNPANGEILWRKPITTPSRAAPTIIDGRIFVTTLDNRLIALNAQDGAVLWEYIGLSETAALVGAASAAAGRDIVVPVFTSGEITALRVENGSVAWSDNIAPVTKFAGISSISDIKALPVIDGGLVYAISFGGKLVAIDQRTGTRVWQRDIGGANTPWLAGDYLFVATSDNDLVAFNRENGVIRWVAPLPKYRDEKDKKGILFWTGPLMAGDKLLLISTDGRIMEFNPENGQNIRTWETGEKIVIPPVIADGTLYILAENGTLTAYR